MNPHDLAALFPLAAAASRRTYAAHLAAVARELGRAPVDVVRDLRADARSAGGVLTAWLLLPSTDALGVATRRGRVAALRAVVAHAGDGYQLPRVRLAAAPRARYDLDPADVARLMLAMRRRASAPVAARFEVLVRLGFEHGLRIGEIVSVDDDACGTWLRVRRKGGTIDDRPLGPALLAAVAAWRTVRPNVTDGALLCSLDGGASGRRWTTRAARAHLATVSRAVLGRTVPPHALRHAGTTAALDAYGGDVRRVQQWARHATAQQTLRYDDARHDPAGEIALTLAGLLAVPPLLEQCASEREQQADAEDRAASAGALGDGAVVDGARRNA